MKKASRKQLLGLKILVFLAYLSIFLLVIKSPWSAAWFALGVASGVGFLLADERYFYRWYQEQNNKNDRFLVSRSTLFLISLPPLAVMVLTSVGNFWASGVVGGLMLYLLLEMTELRYQPELFQQRFLTKTQEKISLSTIRLILLVSLIFFIVIHLLAIL